MSNGTLSQAQARYLRPVPSVYRVGPVGSGFFFTGVQTAIDQAVADGFTDSTNPATVELQPGTYTENVVLKPGVSLSARQPGTVTITGNATFPVSNGLTRAQNTISISNIALTVLNGITLAVSGTAPIQLTLNGVSLEKQTGGDATVAYSINNTGGGSRVRFNAGSSINYNIATGTAMNLERGLTEFRQRNTGIFSSAGVTLGAVAALTNAAALRVWGCDFWFTGPATNVIDIQSASAIVDMLHSWLANSLAGGNGILFTAAGTARIRWCVINMNASLAGYVAKGAAGTFLYSSPVIIGANNQVQNTLTVLTDVSVVASVP